MDELYTHLRAKIKALIQANLQLNQEKSSLLKENDLLQAKQKVAVAQIESMVTRLKSIENPS